MGKTYKDAANFFIHKNEELPEHLSKYKNMGANSGLRYGNNRKSVAKQKIVKRRIGRKQDNATKCDDFSCEVAESTTKGIMCPSLCV